jgi:hypothetical protein
VELKLVPIRNPALEKREWLTLRSGCFTPGRERPGTHGAGGWVVSRPVFTTRKNLTLLEFDARTVHSAASCYTDRQKNLK